MTTAVREVLLPTILVLATGGFLHAQSAPTLDWTENSGSIVTGYAVTIDGVRVDYGLTPLSAGGACGCSIVLPFSGGNHVIIVSAYNSSGETASAPLTIGPTANAGGPYSGQSGTALAVNASGSSAPTGSLVSYDWHWGDGSSDTQSSSPQASHTYTASGTFTITLTVTDNAGATSQATTTATVQAGVSGGGSTPFWGTPAAIPGIIQVEDFDNGGQGVAYYDTTPGNIGGAYRATDVDIQAALPSGYDVGWVVPTEWLKYTVNVATAGSYTVMFRVSALGQGGTFHLEMNGVNVTGELTIPNTGGWQAYTAVSTTVTLAAGPQVARLVMDTATAGIVGNFDWMQFVTASGSTPFWGTAAAIPGMIQAEDFDSGGQNVAYYDTTPGNIGGAYRATDVDIQTALPSGYDVGWVVPGEWLNYSVNVASAGNYTAMFRVASLGQGGTFHLEMNGVDVTGELTIPNTGGWQIYTVVSAMVTLGAGPQLAQLVIDTATAGIVGNFDWMDFASATASTPFWGTPAAIPGMIQAEDFDNGGQNVAYYDTTPGNTGGAYRATDVDIQAASPSGYDVGWVVPAEWLNYSVNVASAGNYTVTFRVAALGQGGTFHLEMNGVDVTGTLTIPNTGGWQTYTTVSAPVALTAGPQLAQLVMDTATAGIVGNFDWMQFATSP
jgi:PKD repeat protein